MTVEYRTCEPNYTGVCEGKGDVSLREDDKTHDGLVAKLRLALGTDASQLPSLEQFERAYVSLGLEASGYNKTKTARVLDIDRRTLHRKLSNYRMADQLTNPQSVITIKSPERSEEW